MDPNILHALEALHKAVWEETRAPVGPHYVKAQIKRENAERYLRRKLATVNPRDVLTYSREGI